MGIYGDFTHNDADAQYDIEFGCSVLGVGDSCQFFLNGLIDGRDNLLWICFYRLDHLREL